MTDSTDKSQVITRFPPSPTGLFHVGSARTALFNYLFSQKMDGTMVLRFEDTDQKRSKPEFEDSIRAGLEWLGIPVVGGARQSERTPLYKTYINKLLENNSAYISQEEEGERDQVIRFRNPNTDITFLDEIRGEITFDTSDLGDFVIAKSLEEPLYHLSVVVDDYEMGITHILRGEDHISNTPRQILIQEAIGAPRPIYAHLPLILGPDRSKLSKRHGATDIQEYQNQGFLPDAFINYLALLGWSPGDDREIFSREALIKAFSLDGIQKGGAIFSTDKLTSINKDHIKKLDQEDFLEYVEKFLPADIKSLPDYSFEKLKNIEPILRERVEKFSNIADMAENGELEYFFEDPEYFAADLMWRDETSIQNTKKHLESLVEMLTNIPPGETFNYDYIKQTVWDYATREGRGNVLWPFRFALCGLDRSPDPFQLAEVLGKDETIERLERAQDIIDRHDEKTL